MHSQLEKILQLAKKTGDRVIVVDRYNLDDSYVVMGFNEYERLIDDFGDDWEDDYADIGEKDDYMDEISDFDRNPGYFGDNEDDFSEEPVFGEKLDNSRQYGTINNDFEDFESNNAKKKWEISKDIKNVTENLQSPEYFQAPEHRNEDDDRYYLETI